MHDRAFLAGEDSTLSAATLSLRNDGNENPYRPAVADNSPRLIRRVNNGHATAFDNTLGTAVAFDIKNLQFAYDISNGTNNPGNVDMSSADMAGGGACSPSPCGPTQVRKVNVQVVGRSMNRLPPANQYFENSLKSQVSLRGMAFVDKYRS